MNGRWVAVGLHGAFSKNADGKELSSSRTTKVNDWSVEEPLNKRQVVAGPSRFSDTGETTDSRTLDVFEYRSKTA